MVQEGFLLHLGCLTEHSRRKKWHPEEEKKSQTIPHMLVNSDFRMAVTEDEGRNCIMDFQKEKNKR